jgi:hypothetical protein
MDLQFAAIQLALDGISAVSSLEPLEGITENGSQVLVLRTFKYSEIREALLDFPVHIEPLVVIEHQETFVIVCADRSRFVYLREWRIDPDWICKN